MSSDSEISDGNSDNDDHDDDLDPIRTPSVAEEVEEGGDLDYVCSDISQCIDSLYRLSLITQNPATPEKVHKYSGSPIENSYFTHYEGQSTDEDTKTHLHKGENQLPEPVPEGDQASGNSSQAFKRNFTSTTLKPGIEKPPMVAPTTRPEKAREVTCMPTRLRGFHRHEALSGASSQVSSQVLTPTLMFG